MYTRKDVGLVGPVIHTDVVRYHLTKVAVSVCFSYTLI